MVGGISGSGGYSPQMQQMRRQNQEGKFSKLDADKSGSLDQTELQTTTDKISSVTGQKINVEEVSKAFDTNNDGLFAQDEMQSMMMEMRGSVGGGGQMDRNSMQALSAYQMDPEQDSISTLLDMLDGEKEEQDEYIPIDTQA